MNAVAISTIVSLIFLLISVLILVTFFRDLSIRLYKTCISRPGRKMRDAIAAAIWKKSPPAQVDIPLSSFLGSNHFVPAQEELFSLSSFLKLPPPPSQMLRLPPQAVLLEGSNRGERGNAAGSR